MKTGLHPKQREVLEHPARFKVVTAGRRWGKCLVDGTMISMADGSFSPIEKLKKGDMVLTLNENTYQIESKPILHVHNNGVKETICIKTPNRSIKCTPNHPFLVNNKWIEAKNIKSGDLITVHRKKIAWERVRSTKPSGRKQTWDLTVKSNHNFIAEGAVTHNTALARSVCVRKASGGKKRRIWYIAPTYKMAKQIFWQELLDNIPKSWIKKINHTEMSVWLKNGSMIECKGADKPDSLRGVGLFFVVLDEFQDMKLDVWTKVIRPTLAKDRGDALIIGTPKGYANLYDVHKLGQDPKNRQWKSWQFPTITSPFIPVEEIEAAKNDMDLKSFRQEFEASFEVMAGRVYYAFDRAKHLGDYGLDPSLPIWVCQDFNVDPMATVIAQPQRNGEVWCVDEIYLHDSNTLAVCEEIERRYWRYTKSIVVYPDPACVNRGSARGESDLDIFRERGFKRIKYRRKHPLIVNRVNALNHMLEDAAGNNRLKINSKCVRLIESFEQLLYKQGTRDVDKGQNIEHITDALGYMIELEYPLRKIEVLGISI